MQLLVVETQTISICTVWIMGCKLQCLLQEIMNHSDCMTPMWNLTLHQVTCTVLAWGVSVLSFLPCHTCILSNYLIVIHNSSSQTPDIKIKMEERPDSSVLTKNKCNEEANNQSVIDLCDIVLGRPSITLLFIYHLS